MSEGHVGFVQALGLFFRQGFDFHGRSSRSAYWWVQLWGVLLGGVVGVLEVTHVLDASRMGIGFLPAILIGMVPVILFDLVAIILLVPETALMVRRSRDAGFGSVWAYILGIMELIQIFMPNGQFDGTPAIKYTFQGIMFVLSLFLLYVTLRPSKATN